MVLKVLKSKNVFLILLVAVLLFFVVAQNVDSYLPCGVGDCRGDGSCITTFSAAECYGHCDGLSTQTDDCWNDPYCTTSREGDIIFCVVDGITCENDCNNWETSNCDLIFDWQECVDANCDWTYFSCPVDPLCEQREGESCGYFDLCCIDGLSCKIDICRDLSVDPVCGNGGDPETGEICDEGTAANADSCYGAEGSQVCATNCLGWVDCEYCGDGEVQGSYEYCEPPNVVNVCTALCQEDTDLVCDSVKTICDAANYECGGIWDSCRSSWIDCTDVYGDCPGGNINCPAGTCICTDDSYKKCVLNDIYWYNSCDQIGIQESECGAAGCTYPATTCCVPETEATTCAGKCGTQTNNCGISVTCSACTTCPNGACDNGETCSSCSADCGSCCGNGDCDNGETCGDTNVAPECNDDCGACPPCGLITATWSPSGMVTEGEVVSLIVNGDEYCEDLEFSFEIWERDVGADDRAKEQPINTIIMNSGSAVNSWEAEWAIDEIWSDNPKYYFIASTNPEKESGDLEVTQDTSYCEDTPVDFCSDYNITNFGSNAQSKCELDNCSAIDNSLPDGVDCEAEGVDCSCTWRWQTGECAASYGSKDIGTCLLTELEGSTNCEESNFLEYAWTALWEWSSGNYFSEDPLDNDYWKNSSANPIVWHYDPVNLYSGQNKSIQCQGGSRSIPCPAQIQLPFFNTYNLIVTLVVIILIYFLISSVSKKKLVKKRKVKKKK